MGWSEEVPTGERPLRSEPSVGARPRSAGRRGGRRTSEVQGIRAEPRNAIPRPAGAPASEEPDLDEFLEEFVRDLPPTLARFFRAYTSGQLTALPHGTLTQLASRSGISHGYLGKLLKDSRWDEAKLRSLLSSHVQRVHGKSLRGVVFEQSFGEASPSVREIDEGRRDSRRGRRNPLTLTRLVLADRDFCCILDSDLWRPPRTGEDIRHRAPGGLPWHGRRGQTWRSALDLVERARRDGIRFDWILLGPSYGAQVELLQALTEMGQRFIAEVPESMPGWLYHPLVLDARAAVAGEYLPPAGRSPRAIKELTGGLTHEEEPDEDGVPPTPAPWKARLLAFYAEVRGLPTDPLGLLTLRASSGGERRHFLGNGFLGVSRRALTEIALSRDAIEGTCRQVADKVGLAACRVRDVAGFRRHLALSALSILFRAERTLGVDAAPVSPKGSA